MKTSIVIPIYNNWHLTHQLLFDIYRYVTDVDEVVIMDDCSPDESVQRGLAWWKNDIFQDKLKVCRTSRNVGFLRNCNLGIEEAQGDIVILCNNDIRILQRDLVTQIKQAILTNDGKVLVGKRLLDKSTGWNDFGGRIFPYLEGWFLAFTKSGWKELGGFDERYIPYDFEDVDLSTTALSLGWKLHELKDAYIEHIGAQSISYSPEREAQTQKNRKKFEEKWV